MFTSTKSTKSPAKVRMFRLPAIGRASVVQQAPLKLLEGKVAHVPPQGGRKHPHQDYIQLNTKNILFLLGGAFEGVEKLIEARSSTKTMGFGSTPVLKSERRVASC